MQSAPLYSSVLRDTLLIFELNDSQGIYSTTWNSGIVAFDYRFSFDENWAYVQAISAQDGSTTTLQYMIRVSHYTGRISIQMAGIN